MTQAASAGDDLASPMRIVVHTIFPDLIRAHCAESLLGRAATRGLVTIDVADLRSHGLGVHRGVDDTVYGGGPGMLLRPDVVAASLDTVGAPGRRLFLSPAGRPFSAAMAHELAAENALTLLCGRYEGVDERVLDAYGFEPVSIGDYVIAGGELAALVVIEAVTRLIPGVMGNDASGVSESFEAGLLEAPAYTRPAEWRGRSVPDVLMSGDHARIAAWRQAASLARTAQYRPDLLAANDESGHAPGSGRYASTDSPTPDSA